MGRNTSMTRRCRLAPGDIALVLSKGTATLAKIESVTATEDDGDRYDVLYNDGTRGHELRRELLGEKIVSEKPNYSASDAVDSVIWYTIRGTGYERSLPFIFVLCNRADSIPGHMLFREMTKIRKKLLREATKKTRRH